MGVASILRSEPSFISRVTRVLGTSGGACVGAMLLASPLGAFALSLQYYTGGGLWRSAHIPYDFLYPHDALLRRTVGHLGLLPEGAYRELRGRFSAHVTPCAWPLRNIGLDDFENDAELLQAIAASCCLVPTAPVAFKGGRYVDGGFSDPMPSATTSIIDQLSDGSNSSRATGISSADEKSLLPTVSISILAGAGVDIAPGRVFGIEQPAVGKSICKCPLLVLD